MTEKNLCRVALMLFIILIYAFYPTDHLTFSLLPTSLYQYLSQAFLSGQLSLPVMPPAELLQLADPYDPLQNAGLRLHDASLYQGKYYLYFGPLPVLFFYMPFKLLTGVYPSDAMAVFFFMAIAFTISFVLLIKIKETYFAHTSELHLLFMGLLLGLANGTPYLLSRPLVYEVAIVSAFALMCGALFFLYHIFDQGYKTKDVFLYSCCLTLTVACRPHFVLVCLALIPGLFLYLRRHAPKTQRLKLSLVLLTPPVLIGALLGLYNYARFGSVTEFGHYWQLSWNNIRALYGEELHLSKIPRNVSFGIYYYFLQPFRFIQELPYIRLRYHPGNIPVDKDYYVEAVAGVILLAPFLVVLLALPPLLYKYVKEKVQALKPLLWFSFFALITPLIVILFLLVLPMSTQRYEVDFLPYLVILSVISLWLMEDHAAYSNWFVLAKGFFYATGFVSILIGLSLSLAYWVLI